MTELPEELGDAALTERLAATLRAHQATRGMRVSMGWTCACGWWSRIGGPAEITAHQTEALLAETKRIVVDTLLHVVGELRESDGCQDVPFELAQEFDAEHLHFRLAAEARARDARVLAALRALTGEAP